MREENVTLPRPFRHSSAHLVLVAAIAIFGGGNRACGEGDVRTDHDGFRQIVGPFLKQHCVKCHGPRRAEAELRLDEMQPNIAAGDDVERWQSIADRLVLGEMPPDDQPQPTGARRHHAIDWIVKELKKIGRAPVGLDEPSKANYLDHDALFTPRDGAVAASPPRVWRLSPQIYREFITDLTKNRVEIPQAFSPSGGEGFSDYARLHEIDGSTVAQLIRNALAVVHYQTRYKVEDGEARKHFGATPEFVELFDPRDEPTREEIAKAIRRQFDYALRRAPTEGEIDRFVALMRKNIADAGRDQGVRTTLAAVLLKPEAIFRREIGAGPVDEHGRRMLAPRELAFALALTLTDERPDDKLLQAAEKGELATREQVEAHVRRIFDDEKIDKPRLLRFFHEYFGYHRAPEVFKDKELFEDHRPDVLVSDTDQLVRYILEKDKDVLHELLTTNKSFVNFKVDRKKGRVKARDKDKVSLSYNRDYKKWTPNQPVDLPKDERAGILTQPSWLVAWSQNFDNDAIRRGKWVREQLLGGTVPDVPITVDAQLPDEPDTTLRHRMRVTREKYCWNCHQRMNPLGLPFEMYDHFGRFREKELDQPVDATGRIEGSGDPKLEGEVGHALQMIHKLAESDRVRQVFVRHAFRYFLGRNETLSDSPTLIAADRAYVESGGSFQELIVALLTSDSFLYRWADPDAAAAAGSEDTQSPTSKTNNTAGG